MIREVLRSVLEEGHRRRMEALSALANDPERERLQALAGQAREARLITVEKVGCRLAEHVFETPAPRDLVEIIRLLESPGGVSKAIARAEEMRAKVFPHGGSALRPVVRDELRPLLLLAMLREFRGEVREAATVYAQLQAVDPQWPYLVNFYAAFVRWESAEPSSAAK